MGRQNEDPAVLVLGSSIVLLQERFKQLQRSKEMREERQVLVLQLLPPQSTSTPYVCKEADLPAASDSDKLLRMTTFSSMEEMETAGNYPQDDPLALGLNSNTINHHRHHHKSQHEFTGSGTSAAVHDVRLPHDSFHKRPRHDFVDTSLRL